MDNNLLLDMAMEVGYQLAMSGAETYRIEESVNRIMAAYNIQVETFSIPNCLHASIKNEDGTSITRMRRIGHHGNDLDSVEKFSNLSRKICRERPSPEIGFSWIEVVKKTRKKYGLFIYLIGNFMGACGFASLFGAGLTDCLISGICGLIIGVINRIMDNEQTNQIFRILIGAFVAALMAYMISFTGLIKNTDAVIIGALMILVPGLLFTNAMRDIIYGDTNSGINRIVQVILIAVSIAVGTATAWHAASLFGTSPTVFNANQNDLLAELIGCFVGCVGFSVIFNIHGRGGLLCCFGGIICWTCYRLAGRMGMDNIVAYFIATFVVSLYSEIMARIRKYPAISYLVVSIFPILPGAGVYYAVAHLLDGNNSAFAAKGMETASIAGVMAAGILIASTIIRLITGRMYKKSKQS